MSNEKIEDLRLDLIKLAEKYVGDIPPLQIGGHIISWGVILLMCSAPSKEAAIQAIKICIKQGMKFAQENKND